MNYVVRRLFSGLLLLLLTTLAQAQTTRWNELDNQFTRLFHTEQYSLAARIATEQVEVATSTFGPNDANVATSVEHLASALAQKGRYVDAITHYQRALAIREKDQSAMPASHLQSLKSLGDLFYWEGDYPEARPLYSRILTLTARMPERDRVETAAAFGALGEVSYEEGKYDEAETWFRLASASYKTACGEGDSLYHKALLRLSTVLVTEAKNEDAQVTYRRAVSTIEHHLGTESPALIPALSGLARLAARTGNSDEAEQLYTRIIGIDRSLYGNDAPALAGDMETLIALYTGTQQFAKAVPLGNEVVRIWEAHPSASNSGLARAYATLGDVYHGAGEQEMATNAYEQAIETAGKAGAVLPTVEYLRSLARHHSSNGDFGSAKLALERAISVIDHRGTVPAELSAEIRRDYTAVTEALNGEDFSLMKGRESDRAPKE